MNNLTYLNWSLLSDGLLLFTIRTWFIHDHVLTLTTKEQPDKNHPDIVCPYLNGILSLSDWPNRFDWLTPRFFVVLQKWDVQHHLSPEIPFGIWCDHKLKRLPLSCLTHYLHNDTTLATVLSEVTEASLLSSSLLCCLLHLPPSTTSIAFTPPRFINAPIPELISSSSSFIESPFCVAPNCIDQGVQLIIAINGSSALNCYYRYYVFQLRRV